jgi:hypothetical protein
MSENPNSEYRKSKPTQKPQRQNSKTATGRFRIFCLIGSFEIVADFELRI